MNIDSSALRVADIATVTVVYNAPVFRPRRYTRLARAAKREAPALETAYTNSYTPCASVFARRCLISVAHMPSRRRDSATRVTV